MAESSAEIPINDQGQVGDSPPEDLSVYGGRWVALVGDEVVGVGDTADLAERFGRHSRLRESLTIRYVAESDTNAFFRPVLLDQIQPIFDRLGQPVYLVGGAVRDSLLGRIAKDLDFVVAENAIGLAFKVANYLGLPAYVLDKQRDIGRVVFQDMDTTLDFARFRGEDLVDDLSLRDFTINAIALPSAGVDISDLIDPCDGQKDIAQKVLQLTYPNAIKDDPIRCLRALRICLEIDFRLADETLDQIQEYTAALKEVSDERIRDELIKMVGSPQPNKALQLMSGYGLLLEVMPEIQVLEEYEQSYPHYENVLSHTSTTLQKLMGLESAILLGEPTTDDRLKMAQERLITFRSQLIEHFARHVDGAVRGQIVLRLGTIYHDVGKAETQKIEADGRVRYFSHDRIGSEIAGQALQRLKMSKEVIRHVQAIVAGHMRPMLLSREPSVSRRAIFRFFRDTGSAGLDICLLSLADHLASRPSAVDDHGWTKLLSVVETLLHHYFKQFKSTVDPKPLLDGNELIQTLAINPGPEVGRLLELIQEAQAAGEIENREQALSLARMEHRQQFDA